MDKVIVGVSGGVDSAVACRILMEEGYEPIGATLFTTSDENRIGETGDAEKVCSDLGIRHVILDCRDEFRDKVIAPFAAKYRSGLTPNPCTGCNADLKWNELMKAAEDFGASFVATGHYARTALLENGRFAIRRGAEDARDQSYMLCRLTQEEIAMTIFPLGGMTKAEVRAKAESLGISVAHKADSQEICFVPDGGHAEFIEAFDGMPSVPGNFVDENGSVLGRHKGLLHYTVGQRKRLGIALGRRVFVSELRPETNEVVLCDGDAVYTESFMINDLRFMGSPELSAGDSAEGRVFVRYGKKGAAARLEVMEGGLAKVSCLEPIRAAAPGQDAVLYKGEVIIASGRII